MSVMIPNVNRALIFQGGGSLGAYEAGVYKLSMRIFQNILEQKAGETSQYFISYLERQ
jgi:hypothetical protein